MKSDEVLMTKEDYDNHLKTIHELETIEKPKITAQIKSAREDGDLKENAEYHAAKELAGHLETRILKLKDQVRAARIVTKRRGDDPDIISLGSQVVLLASSGKELNYKLTSSFDSNPAEGKISVESPMGRAMAGRRAGDKINFMPPSGKKQELEIKSVVQPD